MTDRLDAHCVRAMEENGIPLVGFADREFDSDHDVLIQRTLDPASQDAALGLDAVHLEVDDQSHSVHGGVSSIRLEHDRSTVALDVAGAAQTGCTDGIEIRFHLDPYRFGTLRAALTRLLGGLPCPSDLSRSD